jgi:HD-GYP domain-containing protein (c-di-GMP phosphodiesterase class II)
LRIVAISDRIAEALHMAPQDRRSLRNAAHMHDLGEVAMERDYIQKAGPLTGEERRDLARQPVIGEQEAARASADRAAQLLVRWHHEWWNGTGYPDALRQTEIPLGARILRVADSYAAMTDTRPYRNAMTEDQAREQMIEGAAIEFDPDVVTVLLSFHDLDELKSYASDEQSKVPEPSVEKDTQLFSSFMR